MNPTYDIPKLGYYGDNVSATTWNPTTDYSTCLLNKEVILELMASKPHNFCMQNRRLTPCFSHHLSSDSFHVSAFQGETNSSQNCNCKGIQGM